MVQLDLKLKIVNLVCFAGCLAANAFFNGAGSKTVGDVSHDHPTTATPADWTFGIWGVIYPLLTGFVIYQLFPKAPKDAVGDGISYWFALTCVLNASWLFLWVNEQFILSMFVTLWLLATLIYIYKNLGSYPPRNPLDFFFINAPFSIYTAWISVASLVNILVVVDVINTPAAGAIAILLVSAVAVFSVNYTDRRDIVYAGTILWAVAGVADNHEDDAIVYTACFFSIGALSYSILALVVPRFFKIVRRRFRRGERAPLLVR